MPRMNRKPGEKAKDFKWNTKKFTNMPEDIK